MLFFAFRRLVLTAANSMHVFLYWHCIPEEPVMPFAVYCIVQHSCQNKFYPKPLTRDTLQGSVCTVFVVWRGHASDVSHWCRSPAPYVIHLYGALTSSPVQQYRTCTSIESPNEFVNCSWIFCWFTRDCRYWCPSNWVVQSVVILQHESDLVILIGYPNTYFRCCKSAWIERTSTFVAWRTCVHYRSRIPVVHVHGKPLTP